MCFIAVSKRIKPENIDENLELTLRGVLYDKATSNDDGYFIQNRETTLRSLSQRDMATAVERVDLNNFFCHFRAASYGVKSAENVHGWSVEANNGNVWQFFHNGGVAGCRAGSYPITSEKTDSEMFFQELVKNLKGKTRPDKVAKVISHAVTNKMFWGRAILYNPNNDNLFLFGDFYSYFINGNYQIFTSAPIDLKERVENYNIKGLRYTRKMENEFDVLERKIDGVNIIRNFLTPDWKYENLEPSLRTSNPGTAASRPGDTHRPHSQYTESNESWFRRQESDIGRDEEEELSENRKYDLESCPADKQPLLAAPADKPEGAGGETHILKLAEDGKIIPVKDIRHPADCECVSCMRYNYYIFKMHEDDSLCNCNSCLMVNKMIDATQADMDAAGITLITPTGKTTIYPNCLCMYCKAGDKEHCLNQISGSGPFEVRDGHLVDKRSVEENSLVD